MPVEVCVALAIYFLIQVLQRISLSLWPLREGHSKRCHVVVKHMVELL
jgi:hypothetical protein